MPAKNPEPKNEHRRNSNAIAAAAKKVAGAIMIMKRSGRREREICCGVENCGAASQARCSER